MFLLPASTKNTALFSSKLYLALLHTPVKNTAPLSSKLYESGIYLFNFINDLDIACDP